MSAKKLISRIRAEQGRQLHHSQLNKLIEKEKKRTLWRPKDYENFHSKMLRQRVATQRLSQFRPKDSNQDLRSYSTFGTMNTYKMPKKSDSDLSIISDENQTQWQKSELTKKAELVEKRWEEIIKNTPALKRFSNTYRRWSNKSPKPTEIIGSNIKITKYKGMLWPLLKSELNNVGVLGDLRIVTPSKLDLSSIKFNPLSQESNSTKTSEGEDSASEKPKSSSSGSSMQVSKPTRSCTNSKSFTFFTGWSSCWNY